MMNKIIHTGIAFLLAAGLAGCTLTEKVNVEINPKPTLLLEFPEGDRIETLHVLAYNPQGVFVDSLQLLHPSLRQAVTKAGEGKVDTLLAGVPEGDYRVVCYANLDQSQLAKLEKGVSTLNDLAVLLDPTPEYDHSDALYHGTASATVRRGPPAQVKPGMVPRYYQVELTLQKDEDDTTPVGDYSARLVSVPDAVDGEGTVRVSGAGHTCSFSPELTTDTEAGRRTAEFTMPRFGDDQGVQLVLEKAGSEIARVAVIPSACGIDPSSTQEVLLPIYIEIAIDKIFISILDWNTVIEQNTGVGD